MIITSYLPTYLPIYSIQFNSNKSNQYNENNNLLYIYMVTINKCRLYLLFLVLIAMQYY